MRPLNLFIASILSFQFLAVPLARAQEARQNSDAVALARSQAEVTDALTSAQSAGLVFASADGRTLTPSQVLTETVRTRKLRVTLPKTPTTTTVGLEVTFALTQPGRVAYDLTLRDAAFERRLAATERVNISLNPNESAQNALAFADTVRVLTRAIESQGLAAASNSRVQRAFKALAALLLPQAHADDHQMGVILIRLGVILGILALVLVSFSFGIGAIFFVMPPGILYTAGVVIMFAVGAHFIDPQRLDREGGWGHVFSFN